MFLYESKHDVPCLMMSENIYFGIETTKQPWILYDNNTVFITYKSGCLHGFLTVYSNMHLEVFSLYLQKVFKKKTTKNMTYESYIFHITTLFRQFPLAKKS